MKSVPPKVTLMAILAMFVVPLVLAWMLQSGSISDQSDATTNLGRLVTPVVPLDWSGVESVSGGSTSDALGGYWVILYAVSTLCNEECIATVTGLRQVRGASGREQHRIKIVLLLEPPFSMGFIEELLSIDPGFNLVQNPSKAFITTLAQVDDPGSLEAGQSTVYLLDPLGNIMMTYYGKSSPSRLSKDLKRLLTWSKQDKRS